MDKKKQPLPDTLTTFTIRLSPTLIKRTKLAATLFEESVQTIVSRALETYLKKLETSPDHGLLLIRYAKKLAEKEGK